MKNLLSGKFVLWSALLLRLTPYGGTLWFKYIRAFTEKTRQPPIGLLIGAKRHESNGNWLTVQIIGWTRCCIFRDIATIVQVSDRMAIRLKEFKILIKFFVNE